MSFEKWKLKTTLLLALSKINFKLPTDVQYATIPVLMNNQNVFIKSSTGTGKTAAFLLPILNKIDTSINKIQSLIIAPTRELAMQITDQVKLFGQEMLGLSTALLIGGMAYDKQISQLENAHIVIGTPGRVADLLHQEKFVVNNVETLVLDEADEIVRFGFKQDIEYVFEVLPKYCQIGLFSATQNAQIIEWMNRYTKHFEMIDLNNQVRVNANIDNFYVFTKNLDTQQVLLKVLEHFQPNKTIIFINTKKESFELMTFLNQCKLKTYLINGSKTQSQRNRAITHFKNDANVILVGTDVISRGLDIPNVDLVINYTISADNEDFVHRIGRTGRHDKSGISLTFVNNATSLYKLSQISKEFGLKINEINFKQQ